MAKLFLDFAAPPVAQKTRTGSRPFSVSPRFQLNRTELRPDSTCEKSGNEIGTLPVQSIETADKQRSSNRLFVCMPPCGLFSMLSAAAPLQ